MKALLIHIPLVIGLFIGALYTAHEIGYHLHRIHYTQEGHL